MVMNRDKQDIYMFITIVGQDCWNNFLTYTKQTRNTYDPEWWAMTRRARWEIIFAELEQHGIITVGSHSHLSPEVKVYLTPELVTLFKLKFI